LSSYLEQPTTSLNEEMDPFYALCSSLPWQDFHVPDPEPIRKMRPPKRNTDELKEPAETVAIPTEHLLAVVDRETFHPQSEKGIMMAENQAGPSTFNGVEIGREGVLETLSKAGLPQDLRHNARIFGHIEELEAKLSNRRRWRSCYGAIDRASKYTEGNRWDEVDTTCKKFKDLGRGVFYGVKDGSHHSDEFLDIVRCYDTATPPGPSGYYNYGSIHHWREHDLDLDWVIYVDVAMGKLDGRGGGLVHDANLDDTLTDLVLAGFKVQAKIHGDSLFGEGVGIHRWWKHLDHNEEYIVIFCTHGECPRAIDYDIRPSNLERDRKIYERELKSGHHGTFTAKFRQRRGRNVPVKKTRPIPYAERLKMARGVREAQWLKLARNPERPPPPTAPILTDLNWRIAMNKVPDGPMFRTFCSFVWDPRFISTFHEKFGWTRVKNRKLQYDSEVKFPEPLLDDYLKWSGNDVNGYATDED